MERITQVAIKKDDKIYTEKRPARHHTVLGLAESKYGLSFGGLKGGEQGFVTDTGRFVGREDAAIIALESGQVKELKYGNAKLFSEDLF